MESLFDAIRCGDAFTTIEELKDETVDLVLTSPPYYKQRDYGENSLILGNENTPEEYVAKLLKVVEETSRVLKKTGSIIFNVGDKYDKKGSLMLIPYKFALEVLGKTDLLLINDIEWVKRNPQPRQFKRRLVSSHEPFFHFVKSNEYKYHPERFESEGAKKRTITKPGKRIGNGYFQMIEDSQLTDIERENARRDLEQAIVDVKNGEISSFRMKIRGLHSMAYGGYEGGRKMHLEKKGYTIIRMYGESLKRDVMITPKAFNRETNHPAVFPEEVVEKLVDLTTDVGDFVVDPFSGSGTTCVVARKKNRHYLGIDINEEYCRISEQRLDSVSKQPRIDNWEKSIQEERL